MINGGMGKKSIRKENQKVGPAAAPAAAEQENAPEDADEKNHQVEEGVTAEYIGKRLLFYTAGGNPIIERFIMNYLMDYRCGLMILGLAMGTLFSQWVDSMLPPKN